MKKTHIIGLTNIITVIVLFLGVYYLLMQDNAFHISVGYIIQQSQELSLNGHIVVLALIPIYIAAMVFGSALLSIYLGSMLQSLINRLFNNKTSSFES